MVIISQYNKQLYFLANWMSRLIPTLPAPYFAGCFQKKSQFRNLARHPLAEDCPPCAIQHCMDTQRKTGRRKQRLLISASCSNVRRLIFAAPDPMRGLEWLRVWKKSVPDFRHWWALLPNSIHISLLGKAIHNFCRNLFLIFRKFFQILRADNGLDLPDEAGHISVCLHENVGKYRNFQWRTSATLFAPIFRMASKSSVG